jgi:hypothetical protein
VVIEKLIDHINLNVRGRKMGYTIFVISADKKRFFVSLYHIRAAGLSQAHKEALKRFKKDFGVKGLVANLPIGNP